MLKWQRFFCSLKTDFKSLNVIKAFQHICTLFQLTNYNNVFSEDGKIFKVGRSPKVYQSLPHLPPLTAFFSRGSNILFQISGGAYSQVGHMPPLFQNRGDMHIMPHGCARLYFLFQKKLNLRSVVYYTTDNISKR